MEQSIVITTGDPAGIGPEVIIKSLLQLERTKTNFLILGQANQFTVLTKKLPQVTVIDPFVKSRFPEGMLSFKWVEYAIDLAKQRKVRAMVTGPISKEKWHEAGIKFAGHTELLAEKAGTKNYAMAFYSRQLKVVLGTIHLPLQKVASAISTASIFQKIVLANDFCRRFGILKARLAVCGLNPHAGENGLMGTEEKTIIKPAVERAAAQGLNVTGPLPADTVFYETVKLKKYDVVVSMYHDQALGPLKMLAFDKAVNVTLGLPFVRTSPDHGTAFNIAGKGIGNPQSMLEAIKLAIRLSK